METQQHVDGVIPHLLKRLRERPVVEPTQAALAMAIGRVRLRWEDA